ncbi:hypothetical protein [Senegalia massiliensis]|uniref:Uncharacterized protein n=1 Tax=Senegalia massiliensis TaxID=1720316 RepID=A0A845R0X7_9CLOT|nr:hypothetical protein [Senegalia massiliensis]NBI08221.1 hypothetical protein [Senegalia massiliensis]
MTDREKLIDLLSRLKDEDVSEVYRHSNYHSGRIEINIEFNKDLSGYEEIEYFDRCAYWE